MRHILVFILIDFTSVLQGQGEGKVMLVPYLSWEPWCTSLPLE